MEVNIPGRCRLDNLPQLKKAEGPMDASCAGKIKFVSDEQL